MERQESVETCSVCHEVIRIYSVGVCDHPICFRCSIRMRALCGHLYCAICRTSLPKVYLLREKKLYKDLGNKRYLENRKLSICFQDESVRQEMERVLEHKCSLCRDRPPEKSFTALRDHMRKQHTLFFCDLCVEHVTIFTHERKSYSRQQLALHRRLGDKDNTSYKGHPICRFCDERYMDNEELWRHLRKDHYYCHFCDADGANDYYSDYDELMTHFRQSHFLCEEDNCIGERFTHAFRTKIDLKAHNAQCHNKSMSKAQTRQARTLDLDFQLAPRNRPNRGQYNRGRDTELVTQDDSGIDNRYKQPVQPRCPRPNRFNKFRPEDVSMAIQASLHTMRNEDMKKSEPKEDSSSEEELVHNEENFPALGAVGNNGVAAAVTMATQQSRKQSPLEHVDASFAHRIAKAHGKSIQHSQMSSEMFPTLPNPGSSPCFERKNVKNDKTVPLRRQEPPDGGYSRVIKHDNVTADDDFPELQSKKKLAVKTKSSVSQWTKQTHIENPITKYPKNTKTDHSVSHKIVPLSKNSKLEESKPSLVTLGKVLKDDSEFPSLGRQSSELPLQNAQWVRPNKINNRNINSMSRPVVKNIDNTTTVHVPTEVLDTDIKLNDIKNNKKKQAKLVPKFADSEKREKTLDNIASLLLDTPAESAKDLKPEETIPVKHSKKKKKTTSKIDKEDNPSKERTDKMSYHIEEKQQDSAIVADEKKTEIVVVEVTDKQSQNGVSDDFYTPKPMLNHANKGPTFDADDFPALAANKSTNHPSPPGFNSTVKPPPGFNSKTRYRPPPGFTSQITNDTQAADQNVAKIIDMPMEYTKPQDFHNRNQKLIKDISASLNGFDGRFNQFKLLSGEFRCGQILPVDYYDKCECLFGDESFDTIFPELIALLPDIDKQQQLFAIYEVKSKKSDDNVLKINRESRTDVWKKFPANLQSCPTCQQVILSADYGEHVAGHCRDPDFPMLKSAPSQATSGRNAWIKAT